jgi:hypothetical protein
MKLFSKQEVTDLFRKFKDETGYSYMDISSIIYYNRQTVTFWYLGLRAIGPEAYIALYALLEHEGYLPSCGIENYGDYINLQALEEVKQKHAKR